MNQKPLVNVYISNLSEDVWPFISEISDTKERRHEIEENANLSDRDLFALSKTEKCVAILPKMIDEQFLSYYKNLFEITSLEILTPSTHSGELSIDVMKDPRIISQLKLLSKTSRLSLASYTSSPQFIQLVKTLKNEGIEIVTPECPEEADAWTVNFFGSKSGIRQLSQQSVNREPDLIMPNGLVSWGIVDSARIAANWYITEGGVVLKTNKGHSGAGVLIFRPNDLPLDYLHCQERIMEHLSKDNYWSKFPIIIEKYVQPATSIGGGFPNVEFKITASGRVELLYVCGMRVTKEGVFKGIEINEDILSDQVKARIIDTGFYVGEHYKKEGYKGYFELDFIASKTGDIFVTESNVRRTGGTHVFHTAQALLGKDFMYHAYTLSNNLYTLPTVSPNSFRDLSTLLEPILFDKTSQEGIVIISINLLTQNKFGYIIFGKTRQRALEIELKMDQLFVQYSRSKS